MKKFVLILSVFYLMAQSSICQTEKIPLSKLQKIADQTASSTWGEVYTSEAIPLYSLQDEIIAYVFNYSINKPFPQPTELIRQLQDARQAGDKNARWAAGEFGYLLMSAKKTTVPLITFCDVVSDYYAYAAERDELAKQKFGSENFSLYRVYYMNDLAKWYCYANAEKKVYVKVFPPVMALDEGEFLQLIQTEEYQKPGLWEISKDLNNEWDAFIPGQIKASKADVLIPNSGYVPYHDWSFGCTPTAFTMALAYWDNRGMISGNDYGNLVKYHYQRWDHCQLETDYNVADLQLGLCIAMNTDSMTGSTGSCCWNSGMISETAARGYSFSGSDLYGSAAQYWSWSVTEINAGRPFHMGTPGHSSTGIGYSENYIGSDDYIIRHDTWQGSNSYVNVTSCDLVGTIIPGGQYGAAVNITDPFGDPRYSDNVWPPSQGEDLWAGDGYEITWDYDYLASSYAKIYYSTNSGYSWNTITSYTPNDGAYDWVIPLSLNSSVGRIKVEAWDGSGLEASDGSWGNFTFNPGGYLYTLGGDIKVNTTTDPDYYDFTHSYSTWCAVGVRNNTAGDDWDIAMYDNNSFSNVVASSAYGGTTVDFVVMDGHHTSTLHRGIKAYRYSGSGMASVEFEGYNETLIVGTNSESWDAGDVVEMYDVYLTPGVYSFDLEFYSGTADLDMALFGSSGSAYFAGRSAYMTGSFNSGGAVNESFTVTITSADYYGLCVFANDANSAYFNIVLQEPGTWIGAVDNNWHNPSNWTVNTVPNATIDVTIPNVTNKCWVYGSTAYCNNITVELGSGYDLRIWNQELHVYGNMDFYGQLLMDNAAGIITAEGDVTWYAGSSASIQANTVFWVHGDWNFEAGANVTMNNGIVDFTGTGGSFIRSYEENCYFNDLGIYKGGTNYTSVSNLSSDDLHVHGTIYIQPAAVLYLYSPHSVFLHGDLYNSGELYGNDGTLVFNGNTQVIWENLSYVTTQNFNNLTISSSNSTSISNKDIYINGNLSIENGQFISNSFTISIGGDWDNQGGGASFNAGTGRVIFIGGNYHQYCSDETFYILELNKPLGGALRMQGTHVECNIYDWTAGAVDVIPGGGSFTALDLFDNGIYGAFYLNPGGTINLTNNDGYVDLNGELHIFGGIMNIYGGTTMSYWPFAANALISMSDGILDFHDQGIYIYNSGFTLTESITGGTIRTSAGFWGETNEFTPDYGTMEFYGENDANIYTINACNLNHVLINKTPKKENEKKTPNVSVIDERSGKPVGDGTKSNTLTLTEFLDINGSLVIDNGILNTNGYNIQIEGDWTNYVGDAGFIESTGWVTFDGDGTVATIHTNETFNNLMHSNASGGVYGLTLMDGIVINVISSLDLQWSTLEMNFASVLNVGGDIFIAGGAGLNADDGNNNIEIGGNWTNENYSNSNYYGFWPGGETVTFDGSADQILMTNASQEGFTNIIINKSGGDFRPNNNIQINDELNVLNGDWWDNTAGLTHYLYGNFIIGASGNYYPEGTTCFKGTSDQFYENYGGSGLFKTLIIDKTAKKDNLTQKTDIELDNQNPGTKGGSKSMTLTLNSNMVVFGGNTTTIEEGTFNLNGNSFKSTGNININNGGSMLVDAGAWLSVVTGLYVNNGGVLTTVGVPGNEALVHKDAAGLYALEVNSGGTISANYATFEDMNMNGVWVKDGATVDLYNAFNNCIFYAGANTAYSARLVLNNNQVLNIDNISFQNNPWIPDAYNIGKADDHGEVIISNDAGDFTGPLYEYDPYNRIHWTDYVPGLWTGAVSSDWFNPNNWGDYNVPNTATDVTIPAGTPNDPVINNSTAYCSSVEIQAGASLEVGNDELIVGNTTDIFGELIMNNSSGILNSDEIEWQSGSTDNVTAGEIHVSYWYWQDGTNAQLGTGNTAFITSALAPYDADASFGNLEIVPVKGEGKIDGKASYPVRVSGYCLMRAGTSWGSPGIDFIIGGNWEIESGASFTFFSGAFVTCHSDFTLNGTLYLETAAVAIIHGMFNFSSTGVLDIDDGGFYCDYTVSSGWIDLLGDIQMTTGSVEFPDANISFAGTSTISDGTIIAGRTIAAAAAGAFQPTGGTLELIGFGDGHYVNISNGNFVYDLNVNRSDIISLNNSLIIQNVLTVNSTFNSNNYIMVIDPDSDNDGIIDINSGGSLNINANGTLEMGSNNVINVNSGGTLSIVGSLGNEATITHSSGYYSLDVMNGGTISADYAVFEYMSLEGVFIHPGALFDDGDPAHSILFQNGEPGGRLLTINSDQNFALNNVIFPTNTWGGAYNVYKSVDAGVVNFNSATGGFHGEAYDYDPFNRIHWTVPSFDLDLTVFLEGPFNTGTLLMDTDINGIIPNNHPFHPTLPYFGNPMPDWYYTGTENTPTPNIYVVDWVLVELRDATSAAAALPGTMIAQQAAFVLNTGEVVDLDGLNMLNFTATINDGLYVVIWQRNHLGVISANALVESGAVYTYNFSSGSGQAYGGASAQKNLGGSGIWGMMSGDGDGSGVVQLVDKTNVWEIQAGTTGYLEGDFNMNVQVNNQDKNDYWLPNMGSGSFIPE